LTRELGRKKKEETVSYTSVLQNTEIEKYQKKGSINWYNKDTIAFL